MRPPAFPRLAVACVAAGLLVPAGAGAADAPVLGSAAFAPNGGEGWGTVKPREIFNGGAPSGSVRQIQWTGWGRSLARGTGKMPIYRPAGGYYRTLGRVQLKAYRLGRCPGSTRLAYRSLKFRAVQKPGGRYGRWYRWSGASSLCSSPFGG
jgi:hypothetical protein